MIDRAPFTAAVRAMLAAATGRPCGLGALPLLDGRPAPLPYSVLYPLGGPVNGAPFADASEDASPAFQVTIVGARTDQVEWLGDRVRRAFLQRTAAGEWEYPVTVPGLNVWARELLVDEGVDPASGDVMTCIQRYKFSVTAAA